MHTLTFDPRTLVRVTLIGVGGTGSLILTHLVRIDQAIRALGGQGLAVKAFDPDTVSVTNLTRQNFAPADVGRNKAVTLVERCNLYAGLNWRAYPRRAEAPDFQGYQGQQHLVISCMDSGKSRLEIRAALGARGAQYWLDCGNSETSGQVVLGQLVGAKRLPNVPDLDPSGMQGEEDDAPSCSAAEALTRRHLFVNPAVALQAAQLIGELQLNACTPVGAVYVNLRGVTRTLAIPVERQPKPRERPVPLLPGAEPEPAKRPEVPRRAKVAACVLERPSVVRVNGLAHVSAAPELLERFRLNGELPRHGGGRSARSVHARPEGVLLGAAVEPGAAPAIGQGPDFSAMSEAHKKLGGGG